MLLGYHNYTNHSKGYSLIETLIVVVIISLLVSASRASYISFSRRQTLRNTGAEFAQFLRENQKRARAGEKPVECNTDPLDGYEIIINNSNITSQAKCNNNQIGLIRTLRLPNNITPEPVNTTLTFGVLNKQVIGYGMFKLTLDDNQEYCLSVSSSGAITENVEC